MTIKTLRYAALATSIFAVNLTGSVLAAGAGGDPTAAYASPGPYATTSSYEDSDCTVYRPRNVPQGAPLILWGNGTGGSPSTYGRGLAHWASYGYVVAAANTANAGTGREMLSCIDAVRTAAYGANVDFSRIGAAGHSQGGGGAIMAAEDTRITATAPMQPFVLGLGHRSAAQDNQHAPMLLLSGSRDVLAEPDQNQAPVFRRVDVPVFWATLQGAGHFIPTGNFGDYRGLTTAWWEFQLKGDDAAARLFTGPCSACNLSGWDVRRKGL